MSEKVTGHHGHPLDRALSYAYDRMVSQFPEHGVYSTPAKILGSIVHNVGCAVRFPYDKESRLSACVNDIRAWLAHLGVGDCDEAFRDEYDSAVLKHAGMTLDQDAPTDFQRACALIEEVGEVARALTYDEGDPTQLVSEVTQVGALAAAWLTHIIDKEAGR